MGEFRMNIDKDKLKMLLIAHTADDMETLISDCEIKPVDCSECVYDSGICKTCIQHYPSNFKPKPVIKKIDMSCLVDSDIDCEFMDDHQTLIGKLTAVLPNCAKYVMDKADYFQYCRVRQDHWHHWENGECPLPKGLEVTLKFRNGKQETTNIYTSYAGWGKSCDYDIIAFKIIGTCTGYEY